MLWPEILAAAKLIIGFLPGEVNWAALEQVTFNVFQAGWTKGAWLTSVIANADVIFTNPYTRPVCVLALQAMLDLLNAAKPAPAPGLKKEPPYYD